MSSRQRRKLVTLIGQLNFIRSQVEQIAEEQLNKGSNLDEFNLGDTTRRAEIEDEEWVLRRAYQTIDDVYTKLRDLARPK
jgi:hypothetical protein